MHCAAAALAMLAGSTLACSEIFAPEAGPLASMRAARTRAAVAGGPVEYLRTAERFETPELAFAGPSSSYVDAWRAIRAAPDAAARFLVLYSTAATAEGRLYGLVGLFATDVDAAEPRLTDPVWRGVEVRASLGCVFGSIRAELLLEVVGTGEWSRLFETGEISPPAT